MKIHARARQTLPKRRRWTTARLQIARTAVSCGAWILFWVSLSSCATLAAFHTNSNRSLGSDDSARPASSQPAFTETPEPTSTLTPSPTSTPTPSATSTPTPTSEEPIVIGTSVAGRPIEVYRFGVGPRKLMIIAGMHGGYEWNTIALAEQLILLIQGRPDWIPEDVTLFILPSLNPDGEARAHGIHGRTNENNVDLNRNFPAQWAKEWPIHGCWRYLPVTGGPYPASEPETLAVMQFLDDENIIALINYHSAALGIFPGGQPPDPDSIHLAEAIAGVSQYPYPPIDTGCIFTGQLIDWASMQGVAAVDIELTNHNDTDLAQNLEILHVFLNWRP